MGYGSGVDNLCMRQRIWRPDKRLPILETIYAVRTRVLLRLPCLTSPPNDVAYQSEAAYDIFLLPYGKQVFSLNLVVLSSNMIRVLL